jgi:hypothetical protein
MTPTTKLRRALLAAALLFALDARHASAQDKLPPDVQGDWVAATTTCDSPVR